MSISQCKPVSQARRESASVADASDAPAQRCEGLARANECIDRGLATILTLCPATLMGLEWWLRRFSRALIHESLATLPKRRHAIVLGAKLGRDGSLSPQLEDRLAAGLALKRAGLVERVLLTSNTEELGPMRAWFLQQGVPNADLDEDPQGWRTFESMKRAVEVFGVSEAIICTQRFHLPRSLLLARALGIDALGVVADRRNYADAQLDAIRELGARQLALIDLARFLLYKRRHLL
ncbi:MAG: ElyC/SanA/YdcF family protein [Myxococcota bacterium]|nr:ElyC/SanA/YdcF family protein [Myxococcota bacterium]